MRPGVASVTPKMLTRKVTPRICEQADPAWNELLVAAQRRYDQGRLSWG